MDLKKFEANINKTGFVLEHKVSKILQKHGWTVINGKHYVDDVKGVAREIDIVAYKTKKQNGVQYYTTLIISCKKNDEHAWGLIARVRNPKDPNINWFPLHIWSNSQALNYMLNDSKTKWRDNYIHSMPNLHNSLFRTNSHIFAFQEMHNEHGTVKNDRNIFDSITSLMKAQAYELDSLPTRKKTLSYYNFNLLSIAETDLIKLSLDHDSEDKNVQVRAEEIDDEKYIASYIINRKETQARIHFIRFDAFGSILPHYDKLHGHNVRFFEKLRDDFYADAVQVYDKRKVFADAFASSTTSGIWLKLLRLGWKGEYKTISVGLRWNEPKQYLRIDISDSELTDDEEHEKIVNALNNDEKLREDTRAALKRYFRYEGAFKFVYDPIPF